MRENLKRITKNIIIVLLLGGVAVLTWLNWFSNSPKIAGSTDSVFTRLISTVMGRDEDTARTLPVYTAYTESAYSPSAARPAQAVLHADGELYHFVGESDMDTFFQRLTVPLATALESISAGRILDQAQWRSCLGGNCLLLQYCGEMPMYYLSAALGAVQNEDLDYTVTDLMLESSGDTVTLLAKTPDGTVYAYNTALRSLNRQALTADFEPSEERFACEIPELLDRVPDETLIGTRSLQILRLSVGQVLGDTAASGSDRIVDAILESLGFNTYTVASYIESDATRVYVEQMRTLRITGDAALVYSDQAQEEIKPMIGMAMSVRAQDIARSAQIMEKAVTPYLGAAEAYLARQYYDDLTENYVVVYRVAYEGKKIDLQSGYLARFEFRGTELVKAYVNLLSFSLTPQTDVLLPSLYAAAAAGTGEGTDRLELRYAVRQGTASCAWVSGED